MNRPEDYKNAFDDITPWSGIVPQGYIVDYFGVLTKVAYRTMWLSDPHSADQERHVVTQFPPMGDGDNNEAWFEALSTVLAVREARGNFIMMTLGAHYGMQASWAYKALQMLNPMPCKLVAVDAGPENCQWIAEHFRDNGIPSNDYWLLQMAMSGNNDPVFFPVGASGSGANNCVATNDTNARLGYIEDFVKSKKTNEALRNLLLHNTTGIIKNLTPGRSTLAEIKLVSAIALADLLGPFTRVDYIEADIQSSEILVFPPAIELLNQKVRRIHLGTHGEDVHKTLHKLFVDNGWEIMFSYEGGITHQTALGPTLANDGLLTAINPRMAYQK